MNRAISLNVRTRVRLLLFAFDFARFKIPHHFLKWCREKYSTAIVVNGSSE